MKWIVFMNAPIGTNYAAPDRPVAFLFFIAFLCSCSSTPAERAADMARAGGFESEVLLGRSLSHQAYYRIGAATDSLFVFIDGDGSPWISGGTRVARDPTPRLPLALQLAARTDMATLYLGRPCYFGQTDAACQASLWTSARYSRPVVDSLATALRTFLESHHFSRVTLVGYSGGGALAVLLAPRVPEVGAVVTIAANLDVSAWTRHHGYLHLDESLDPSDEPPLPVRIRQWHLVGARDMNVPPEINARFWSRVPETQIWIYAQMDHACCWVKEWASILSRLRAEMDLPDSGRALQ